MIHGKYHNGQHIGKLITVLHSINPNTPVFAAMLYNKPKKTTLYRKNACFSSYRSYMEIHIVVAQQLGYVIKQAGN
jgi:hypothetical protein